ncbi:hypothetical protein HHK36_013745 [Tetracentron sinense]|uniref:Uncharacterized protein n=1 Tax=Tetracentron sinense TaxID=13715 RepID=A0A834ZDX2_TETSI|nr:hypothetical protein HHK36_013745 [Tetracentron sinense]
MPTPKNNDLFSSLQVCSIFITMEENGNAKEESQDITAAETFFYPLTILSFLLSLPMLALDIWLLYMKDYDCEYLLKLPRLRLGISIGMFFVFLISNVVVFCRSQFPMPGGIGIFNLLSLLPQKA